MYIVTRYVVWEVLKVFLGSLTGLTLMVTLGMVFQEGVKAGAPPLVMLRILPYMLPAMFGITIPVAMLYAVSNVFGRMTGTNEVVALKSLGINPMVLVWPVLVLACFLSLGTVWMYEIAATWCKPSIQRILCESLEDIVYSVLQNSKSLDGEQFPFSITVKGVEGRKLIRPVIILKGQADRAQTTLVAEEADLTTDRSNPAAPVLVLTYTKSQIELEGSWGVWDNSTQYISVPITPPPPDRYHRDWVAMRDIPLLVAELQASIVNLRKDLRLLKDYYPKANQMIGNLYSNNSVDSINAQIADRQFKIDRLRTEPYRRWSNGFTCLCFALIGMPVAMVWRHADALTNFFVCFLPILAIYYPLLMLGDDLTTSGTLHPIFFWMGNIVLAIPAITLLRWIIRH
jgi:lipopolysaccharide export system permease protein